MPTKSSTALIGTRVEVYWNLHKNVYSVRALNGPDRGRVVAHVDAINLVDATFAVQPAGRARVLAEGRKNVHAFVRGIVSTPTLITPVDEVTYNPYKAGTFVWRASGRAVREVSIVQARSEYGRPVLAAI